MQQDMFVGFFIKYNIADSGIFVFMFLSIYFANSKLGFGFFLFACGFVWSLVWKKLYETWLKRLNLYSLKKMGLGQGRDIIEKDGRKS